MRMPRVFGSSSFWRWLLALAVSAPLSQACGGDDSSGGAGTAGSAGSVGSAGSAGSAGRASSAGNAGITQAGSSGEAGAGGEGGTSPGATSGEGGEAGQGVITEGAVPTYLKQVAQSSFFVGLDYGSPYDSIVQQPITSLNSAIEPGFKTAPVAGQVTGSTFIQLVETKQDLYSASDVSVSFNVKSGLFGASAKVDYAQSKDLDSSKVYLFVDATAGGLANKISNPTLTKEAQAMSPLDFYQNFGDRYVSEIVTGVELYGTIEIQTTSETDKQSVVASLSASYGPSSVSASYSNTVQSIQSTHSVTADYHTIGFTPAANADLEDPVKFFTTAANFANVIGDAADTNAQSLTLIYASYYGLAGYPGVPAGTADKVAVEASALDDFLLYSALVQHDFKDYFADPAYSSLPFFTGMQKYQADLSTFLLRSFTNSQSVTTAPVIDPAARIEAFTTTTTASSSVNGAPYYKLHTIGNGVVPKRISDYEIPLRYSHNGMLNGVAFAPIDAIPPSTDITQKAPIVYPLYLVDKTITPAPQRRVLAYRWGTGSYFVDKIAGADGLPDAVATTAALNRLTINDATTGTTFTQFLVVNRASGEVLTEHEYANQLTQQPYQAGNAAQLWQFRVGKDGDGCAAHTTYTPGTFVYFESVASGSVTAYGSRWMDIAYGNPAPGTPVNEYNDGSNGCAAGDTFYLYPVSSSASDTQLIGGWGPVSAAYISVDPSSSTAAPGAGAKIIVQAKSGNDNQLWRLIPTELIDTTP